MPSQIQNRWPCNYAITPYYYSQALKKIFQLHMNKFWSLDEVCNVLLFYNFASYRKPCDFVITLYNCQDRRANNNNNNNNTNLILALTLKNTLWLNLLFWKHYEVNKINIKHWCYFLKQSTHKVLKCLNYHYHIQWSCKSHILQHNNIIIVCCIFRTD